jgi:hypothetical protein
VYLDYLAKNSNSYIALMNLDAMNADKFITILRLAPNGSNWILYRPRFLSAIGAKGLTRHVTGGAVPPIVPSLGASPTDVETAAWKKAVKEEE